MILISSVFVTLLVLCFFVLENNKHDYLKDSRHKKQTTLSNQILSEDINNFEETLYRHINNMLDRHFTSSQWQMAENMKTLNYISQVELLCATNDTEVRYLKRYKFVKQILLDRTLQIGAA